MTMTARQISDHYEIRQVLTRYCHALDLPAWSLYDGVWTTDATIEFHDPVSNPTMTPTQFLARLMDPAANSTRLTWQHQLRNTLIDLGEEGAFVISDFESMNLDDGSGPGALIELRVGGWWEDRFVRTSDGWRIGHRKVHIVRSSRTAVSYEDAVPSDAVELIRQSAVRTAQLGSSL